MRDVEHGALPLCVSTGQSRVGGVRRVVGIGVGRWSLQPGLRRARGCTRSVMIRVDSVSSHFWGTRGVASVAGPWTALAHKGSVGQKDSGGGPLGHTTTWRSWLLDRFPAPHPAGCPSLQTVELSMRVPVVRVRVSGDAPFTPQTQLSVSLMRPLTFSARRLSGMPARSRAVPLTLGAFSGSRRPAGVMIVT